MAMDKETELAFRTVAIIFRDVSLAIRQMALADLAAAQDDQQGRVDYHRKIIETMKEVQVWIDKLDKIVEEN